MNKTMATESMTVITLNIKEYLLLPHLLLWYVNSK